MVQQVAVAEEARQQVVIMVVLMEAKKEVMEVMKQLVMMVGLQVVMMMVLQVVMEVVVEGRWVHQAEQQVKEEVESKMANQVMEVAKGVVVEVKLVVPIMEVVLGAMVDLELEAKKVEVVEAMFDLTQVAILVADMEVNLQFIKRVVNLAAVMKEA